LGIKDLALADTTGSSTPETIHELFSALLPELKNLNLGAHLHSTKEKAQEKKGRLTTAAAAVLM